MSNAVGTDDLGGRGGGGGMRAENELGPVGSMLPDVTVCCWVSVGISVLALETCRGADRSSSTRPMRPFM